MKRRALRIGLLSGLLLTWTVSVLAQDTRTQDTVTFINRKTGKEEKLTGVIQTESAAGITIKQGAKTQVIPALDIVHVDYKVGEKVKGFQYKEPFSFEKKGLDPKNDLPTRRVALAKAQSEFEKLAGMMTDNPLAVRYLQYKSAMMPVLIARADPTQREAAITALDTYRKEHSAGWEIVPCIKLLAQLREEKGDLLGAKDAYLQLRILKDVPKDLLQESNILVANLQMRAKKYDEAEDTLRRARDQMADDDPQKPAIVVHLCETQLMQGKTQDLEKQLQAAINGTSESPIRALAHNTLGDYYRQKNQDEDAFWQYLRVDVLYPQDREEHARALYWLSKLYDSVKKDKGKAQECVEKLKSKEFEGAEYVRRLGAEK